MNTDFHISALGLAGLVFVGSTATWLFWNGVLGIARYVLTGAFP